MSLLSMFHYRGLSPYHVLSLLAQPHRYLVISLFAWVGLNAGCDPTSMMLGDALEPVELQEDVTLSSEAVRWEQRVAENPSDLKARGKLLELYSVLRFGDSLARERYHNHILWVVEHAPDSNAFPDSSVALLDEDDTLLQATRPLWEAHINGKYSTNSLVIRRAAEANLLDPATAERYLNKGLDLEPSNFYWPDQIGQLHKLAALSLEGQVDHPKAQEMLKQFKKAYTLASGNDKRWLTLEVAWSAALAGAEEIANEYLNLIPTAFDDPNDKGYAKALHYRHVILGILALNAGDLSAAEQHLLAASEVPATGLLARHGPNMLLALKLLEHGKNDVVLEYFQKCRNLWLDQEGKLQQWATAVKVGETPAFEAHLYL